MHGDALGVQKLGVHHMLRVEAFRVRNDWAGMSGRDVARSAGAQGNGRRLALIRQLRREAIDMPVSNPYLVRRAGSTDGGANSVLGAGARALAIPGCLVMAGLAAGLLLAPFERHPMWPRPS